MSFNDKSSSAVSKEIDVSAPYFAAISWDDEAGVWYVSDTDFPGLVAEAETQQQLVQKVRDLVPDLYDANRHLVRQDRAREEVAIQLTLKRLETIKLAAS